MKTLISHSAAQTYKLGQALARMLVGSEAIALFGQLGAGKTQFTKGLARALGITKPITSPTFTIFKSYPFKRSGKKFLLNHFDFYRIRSAAEIANAGFFEALTQKHSVTVIEWPERAISKLPKNCIKIYFTYGKQENQRKIRTAGVSSAFTR